MNTEVLAPNEVLEQLTDRFNAHDLDGLVDCFAADYELTDPARPARSFIGSGQVRRNWGTLFAAAPDIRLEVQGTVTTDTGFWMEGRQVGPLLDGGVIDNQLIFIATVSEGRIVSARIYVCPVEHGGPGIDATINMFAGRAAQAGQQS